MADDRGTKKGVSGTREWSEHSINVSSGCANGCLYCYAKEAAIRYGRKTPADWTTELIKTAALQKGYSKRKGRIMLPTTHDITPATLRPVITVAVKLVQAGNEVLIVSKPDPDMIEELCGELTYVDNARQLVTFRFSIGSYLDETLRYWEPNAPCFVNRLATLVACFRDGWQTSVSMEPMLERRERMVELVHMLSPVVTDTIWLGKMNKARSRLQINGVNFDAGLLQRLDALEMAQADGEIGLLHKTLQHHPLVRWKESIKKVVGLPLATEAGTDE
jgi:hypothetical protein